MNKTFKVARSLTRGTVVTSEKASSYQGKAVKTVIAAAVALAAGVAMAATDAETPATVSIANGDSNIEIKAEGTGTITENANVNGLTNAGTITGAYDLTLSGKNTNTGKLVLGSDAQATGSTLGNLTITAGSTLANSGYIAADVVSVNGTLSTGMFVNGSDGKIKNHLKFETLNLNQGGSVVIDAVPSTITPENPAMSFSDGTINFNGGSFSLVINKETVDSSKIVVSVGNSKNQNKGIVNFYQGNYAFGDVKVDNGSVTVGVENKDLNPNKNSVSLSVNSLSLDNTSSASIEGGTVSIAEGLTVAEQASLTVTGGTTTIGKNSTVTGTLTQTGGTIVNKGTFTIANKSGLTLGGTNAEGALFDNQGKITGASLTIDNGATVSTSITEKTYAVAETTINKGGVLNLTSLNSDDGTRLLISGTEAAADGKTNAQAAVVNLDGGAVTLNGSVFQGRLKLGTNKAYAQFNINSGDYKLEELEFANNSTNESTVTVETGASLDVGTLTFNNGQGTFTNNGTLTLGSAAVTGEKAEFTDEAFVNAEGAKLYTDYTNLVKVTRDKDTNAITAVAADGFGKAVASDSGSVFDSAYTGKLTLADLTKFNAAIGNLVLLKAELADAEGGNVKFDDAASQGVVSPSTTLDGAPATGTEATLKPVSGKTLVIANVDTGSAKTVAVNTADAGLTLAGNNGTMFGASAEKITVTGNHGLTLGYEEMDDNKSSINGELAVGTTDAASSVAVEYGYWTAAKGLSLNNAGSTVTVASALDAAWVDGAGTVTLNDGTFAVLGSKPVEEQPDTPAAFQNAVNVSKISFGSTSGIAQFALRADAPTAVNIVSVGETAEQAEAVYKSVYGDDSGRNVIYLTKQAVFADTTLNLGGANQATDLLIDVAKVAKTTGYAAKDGVTKNTITATSTPTVTLIGLNGTGFGTDADGNKTLQVAAAGSTGSVTVDTKSWVYGTTNGSVLDYQATTFTENNLASGKITFKVDEKALRNTLEGYNFAEQVLADAKNVDLSRELTNEVAVGLTSYLNKVEAAATDAGVAAADIPALVDREAEAFLDEADLATNMAGAAGAFTTALDINDQVTAAIDRRNSIANVNVVRGDVGVTPWVDVFGTTNEAKRLYGEGAGYEADIYGAVLGFDYTASCGGTLGLAFNVGTADANSKGISPEVTNDVDFYGVSLYAAKQFGALNVKADFGYIATENDLKLNAQRLSHNFSEKLDGDVLTFGVGAEYLVNAGAFNVVPHAGIRVTNLGIDDSKYGADYDDMTVYQMPLGVAFSGTFETNGWKVAPMVDVAVVPAFGDKDAVATYFGGTTETIRAVDTNPVQGTLGVEAQNGAFTFGLNYRLTAGGDDRLNNSFNANLRYAF